MKAMYADAKTGGELQFGTIPSPKAYGNNILIEVHATSMNPHDWKYLHSGRKVYAKFSSLAKLTFPKLMLGHDVSGVIVAVGEKVNRFSVGDQVFAMSAKTGAFAEYISIDQRMAAPKPAGLTHVEAATIPMASLTALQALRMAKIKAGDNVLVIGGSGGVGIFAIQIAKAKGAKVTAVCSGKNAELVKTLGADVVVDYTKTDFHECGDVFDIVFDTVGGETGASCKGVMVKGGNFVCTNPSRANAAEVVKTRSLALLTPDQVKAATLLAMPRGGDLREIGELVDAGKVKTVVDKTFELSQLQASMDYSKLGRTRGKIGITVK
ncbi:MAG: zinc-binding alcohol dehydrogenase [Moraxellaceae bacterium]|nr:MAG: zinc-binding alcohol dehydrogenase [Moraxellaceae bacterium]